MPLDLKVGLLGPVALYVDGKLCPISSVPQRVVLARLVLSPGRSATTAALIDALWAGNPPRNAVGNLHAYISRLRRAVGTAQLTREPAGYRLHVGEVDIDQVQRLVAEARAAAGTEPARAAQLLGQALGTWRGEPLSDLPDTASFAPDLARLQQWRRGLREEWFELRLAAGEAVLALPDLEQAAAAEPLGERLHLVLARALHQVGRTAEALRVTAEFRRRMVEDLGLDPSPALAELQHRLLNDDPDLRIPQPQPGLRPRHAPGDRFIGRRDELAATQQAVRAHRLVTVVGPGGIGKTRLVREVLDRLGEQHRVVLAELGEVSSAQDVATSAGVAFGLRTAPGGVPTAIADLLGPAPAVLVVDNCEHVLDAARQLVEELLGRCPALRVLATSRQRLGVSGERVLRLGPLAEPDQVELFCDRAALLRAGFTAEGPDRVLVGHICRELDGLPLAVELAARREAVFGLVQLRDRLAAGLDVLEPARHADRTSAVRATVEWSYQLLAPQAQQLFDRLAVCRGGFTLDALDQLVPTGLSNPPALLAELVEASLVVVELAAPPDPPRYRLLEVVRRVGLEHLSSTELDQARDGHARWMQRHAETIHERQCHRGAQAARLLRRDAANLREALSWLIDSDQWDRAGRLGILVALAVSDDPQFALVEQLRRLEPPGDLRDREAAGLCAAAAGAAAWVRGASAVAEPLLTYALRQLPTDHPKRWIVQLLRLMVRMFSGELAGVEADAVVLRDGMREATSESAPAPEWAVATAVCCAALMHLFTGHRGAAEQWIQRDQPLLDRMRALDGFIPYTLGELAARTDPQRALAYFEQAFRQCDAQGHRYNRAVVEIGRVAVLIRLGRGPEAARCCRSLIEDLRAAGMWPQLWIVLRLAAELLVTTGDVESAAVLLTAADADPLAPVVLGPDLSRQEDLWVAIHARLAPAEVVAAREHGRRAARTGAVSRALRALAAVG